MRRPTVLFALALACCRMGLSEEPRPGATVDVPHLDSPFRAVDLNVGQSATVTLANDQSATVKLVALAEQRDDVREAVREARVTVEVNGRPATLVAANYRLPITVGGVQIDCCTTRGCVQPKSNPWTLLADARLRLWPAGAPWIQPCTFRYPLAQRWFASDTQMANEPTFVDGGEDPAKKTGIYYHWGLDAGGCEGLVDVMAATDGVVVSAGLQTLGPSPLPEQVKPRYDVVYLRDGRGWFFRYSHLHSFDPALRPGMPVKIGQKIGLLGKQGASGGWSHLHFDIVAPQPNGRYGITDAYAFYWQAYQDQYHPPLRAVARPHHLCWTGEPVTLDGSRSWSAAGPGGITRYDWRLSDGATAAGPTVDRRYTRPGYYSEILKVTDAAGRSDYDFAVVQVVERQHPEQIGPTIHAAYWPSFNLQTGDEVTFKVRSFRVGRAGGPQPWQGCERWDFGDGSPAVETHSDGNAQPLAQDGYAVTRHRYARAGEYVVTVTSANDGGQTATAHLHVTIGPARK